MKLDKAIELLQLDLDNPGSVPIEILNEAQELGIEAIKRRKYQSEQTSKWADMRLPGETEE